MNAVREQELVNHGQYRAKFYIISFLSALFDAIDVLTCFLTQYIRTIVAISCTTDANRYNYL